MKLSTFFTRQEFACKCGCGYNTVDAELLVVMETVRDYFGKPVIILSGCRCPSHNAKAGGASQSQHLLGRAADFYVKDVPLEEVYAFIDRTWPNQFGLKLYRSWVHVDTRCGAPWRVFNQ